MCAAILDNVRTYVLDMLNGIDELRRHHHLTTPVNRCHLPLAISVVAFRVYGCMYLCGLVVVLSMMHT